MTFKHQWYIEHVEIVMFQPRKDPIPCYLAFCFVFFKYINILLLITRQHRLLWSLSRKYNYYGSIKHPPVFTGLTVIYQHPTPTLDNTIIPDVGVGEYPCSLHGASTAWNSLRVDHTHRVWMLVDTSLAPLRTVAMVNNPLVACRGALAFHTLTITLMQDWCFCPHWSYHHWWMCVCVCVQQNTTEKQNNYRDPRQHAGDGGLHIFCQPPVLTTLCSGRSTQACRPRWRPPRLRRGLRTLLFK